MASGRERAVKERSLVCLLTALRGYKTTVELRNEDSVEGTVTHVDGFMNVTISNAKFVKSKVNGGEVQHFPTMFVLGEKIRYVQIPDEIDMRQAIESELKSIGESRKIKRERRKIKSRK
jgi:small nuclear ribonucleoprotein (snRNP)-like protein